MQTIVTGGASTMSRQPGKRPTHPNYQARALYAEGCTMYVAPKEPECPAILEVIDWPMGQHGPIFGYNPEWLIETLKSKLLDHETATSSYAPFVEDEVAALLGELFPDVEEVRFGKNGSDVCAAAVKLARAVTERDPIAAYGYHGNDAEFAHLPQNRGVPQPMQDLVRWFRWDDIVGLFEAAEGAACVIVEVPPTENRDETAHFLEVCREVAHKSGAFFILDEVVTGFRLSLRGAAGYYGVMPDLYCWGKALSNGYAVSALGGRGELMREFQNGVFFSGTFFDDPLGLTAARATLKQLIAREEEVYAHLWAIGQQLKDGFNELARTYNIAARCAGQAPRTVFEFDNPTARERFNVECLRRGVLFDRPQFSSMAHTRETVERSLDAVEQVFRSMKDGG